MKKGYLAVFSMLIISSLIILFACSNPAGGDEGEGTFTINLSAGGLTGGNGMSRSALPYPPNLSDAPNPAPGAPTLAQLNFRIFFTPVSGGNGPRDFSFRGDEAFTDRIPVGTYTVRMEVRPVADPAYLYAQGDASGNVTIVSGQNTPVSITLYNANDAPVQTYAITMQDDGDGTASASPNPAAQGATVNISATPDNGFKFKEWEIVSPSLTLSPNATTSPATFTMPAGAVTIKALFEEVPLNTPYISLSSVSFSGISFGAAQPAAQTITISNTGTAAATVSDITLGGTGAGSFTLDGDLTPTIVAGATATFTVQPNANLNEETHSAVITVTYSGGLVTGATATGNVSIEVTLNWTVTNNDDWLRVLGQIRNAGDNQAARTITVVGNVDIDGIPGTTANTYPADRGFGNVTGLTVTIVPQGASASLRLDNSSDDSRGNIIFVGEGQTVTINGLRLEGRSNNNQSIVRVLAGGTLNLMSGSISGNRYVAEDTSVALGGGVYLVNNSAAGVAPATFNMSGGTITDNHIISGMSRLGGGVYVGANNTFNMSGGTISDNYTPGGGGGVFVHNHNNSTFNMSGGTISGNTVIDNGGGVQVQILATFNMSGGTISGNTAGRGGGVDLADNISTNFRMSGGTIYGSNESVELRNTATNGAALFKSANAVAEHGIFSPANDPAGIWTRLGDLLTSNDTIRVANGDLVP